MLCFQVLHYISIFGKIFIIMKYLILVPIIVTLCFAACDKPRTNIVPVTTPQIDSPQIDSPVVDSPAVDSSYVVAGVVDTKVPNVGSVKMAISVSHLSGVQKKMTFSLSGLPTNASAVFDPASGTAPFATVMTITTLFAKPGVYPVKLTVTPETGKPKEFTFDLTIESTIDCKKHFYDATVGQNGSISILNSLGNEPQSPFGSPAIEQDNTTLKLYLLNAPLKPSPWGQPDYIAFGSVDDKIEFEVNCDDGTINIIEKQINGFNTQGPYILFSVSGNGTIDWSAKSYEIEYTSVSPTSETNKFVVKGKLN